MICEICQKQYEKRGPLHGHLKRVHSISQQEFYHDFYPRYDLHSGELINYKNYEQYFSSKFNSRDNFVQWALDNPNKEEVKQYCVDFLRERRDRKGIEFLPSHSETKSLFFPSYFGLMKIFGSIQTFLDSVPFLKSRFVYNEGIRFKNGYLTIYQDTREQTPLVFSNPTQIMKLSVGDYTAADDFYSDVMVERKSLQDLCGTLSMNLERFEEEIARAAELGLYLVVVVDSPYQDVLDYSPSNSFAKKTNGARIFHIIRYLMQKFDNIQFVFCSSRFRSAEVIERIFRLGEQAKRLDLDFLKEGGVL